MNDKDTNPAVPRAALRARMYIGERDRHGGQPLYSAIVMRARHEGMAGATVVRGIAGYGAHAVVHAASIVDMSADLPLVIEIVDEPQRVRAFVAAIAEMMDDGMITTEEVSIVYQSQRASR